MPVHDARTRTRKCASPISTTNRNMKTTIIITMAVLTVIILAYIAYEMKHAYTLQDEDENEKKATTEGSETKSSKEGEK